MHTDMPIGTKNYLEMVSSIGGFKYVHADMGSCAYEPLPRYHLTIQLQISLGAFLSQASLGKAFPFSCPQSRSKGRQVSGQARS